MDISHLLSSPVYRPSTSIHVPATAALAFTFIPYIPQSTVPSPCNPPVTSQSTALANDLTVNPTFVPLLPVPVLLPILQVPILSSISSPQFSPLTPSSSNQIAIPHIPDIPLPTPQANSLLASSLLTPTPTLSIVPPSSVSARFSSPILQPGFVDTGGSTSFAQRHPLKDVQVPRFRVRGSKSDAVKLDQAERRAQKADKAEQLQEGIDIIIKLRDLAIKDLADKLSVHEKVIQTLVNGGTHYVKHRRPGAFNALVHKATGEMNIDLKTGQCYKLKDIQNTVLHGMENDTFSQAYIDEAIEELEQTRKVKTMGSRSSNTAAYADARATTGSLTNELVGLGMRTGVTGLALFVKGHIHDDFADTIIEFNGSSAFFLDVFNMQPADVCSRFHQWVCNRKLRLDVPDNLQTAQNECAVLIKKGLRMITNIPNLGMNYVNYSTAIQQKHHVELLGWPQSIPFANPHHITVVTVARKLQHALSVATCKWVVMSSRRVKEHSAGLALAVDGGDTVGKKRKSRSDRGKKRKRPATTEENDGSRENEENDDDDERDLPPPAKKRLRTTKEKANTQSKAASTARKLKTASAAKNARRIAKTLPPTGVKSKEYVDSEDDESDS